MLKPKRTVLNKVSIFLMPTIGVILIAFSTLFVSSLLAILGVTLLFWGAILFYIKPIKHVPLSLFNAMLNSQSNNIERILMEYNLIEKGIYLPPKSLKNIKNSIVFVPKRRGSLLPIIQENTEELFSKSEDGIFLDPVGLGLMHFFERYLSQTFATISFSGLQKTLQKLLVDDLELIENIEIQQQETKIIIEIVGSLISDAFEETDCQPRTHAQIGFTLSSALACILAKTIGKPIIIQKEVQMRKNKTTLVEYCIIEE